MFKNLKGEYKTLENLNELEDKTVVYVTDEIQQSQYIRMYQDAEMDAVFLTHNIDSPFITMLEQKNEGLTFRRIDADLKDALKGELDEDALKAAHETLEKVFRDALSNETLQVKVEDLKNDKISSMITLSEESRRMQEMMRMYGMADFAGATEQTLVLNANNALVKFILENGESEHVPMMCRQLYDLAMISHQPLNADQMSEFIQRSNEIMMLLTK